MDNEDIQTEFIDFRIFSLHTFWEKKSIKSIKSITFIKSTNFFRLSITENVRSKMSANFYDDFRNPRNEIRQKKLFRKKTIYGIFRIPKCLKVHFWHKKKQFERLYHFKTSNYIKFIFLAFIWSYYKILALKYPKID